MGLFTNLLANKSVMALRETLKESSVVRDVVGAKGWRGKLAAGAKGLSAPGPMRRGLIGAGVGAGAGAVRANSKNDGPLGYAGNMAAGATAGVAGSMLFGRGAAAVPGALGLGERTLGGLKAGASSAFVHAGQVPKSLDDTMILTKNFMKSVRDGWRT